MARPWSIPFLNPDEPLRQSVRKSILTRLREMESYEAGTREGSDIEQLHDMRVSSRRLQALFKIFEELFPKKEYREHYMELRLLIRALGAVRELDVFIATLREYRAPLTPLQGRALDLLIARQELTREQKRKELLRLLSRLGRSDFGDRLRAFVIDSLPVRS